MPPKNSGGSGKAEASYHTETKTRTCSAPYTGLSGPALGAHCHGAVEARKNAGIVLPFKAVQSQIKGTATLTEHQAADLLAGKWYANIRKAANPGGELRGRMAKQGADILAR